MRRLIRVVVIAVCAALPSVAQAGSCPTVDPGPAGLYTLNGEHEVGSQILLRPDGRFEFMLAYGAIDQYGSGCWSVKDKVVALRVKGRRIPAQASPVDRRFRGMYLVIGEEGQLLWPLPDFRGRYERD